MEMEVSVLRKFGEIGLGKGRGKATMRGFGTSEKSPPFI